MLVVWENLNSDILNQLGTFEVFSFLAYLRARYVETKRTETDPEKIFMVCTMKELQHETLMSRYSILQAFKRITGALPNEGQIYIPKKEQEFNQRTKRYFIYPFHVKNTSSELSESAWRESASDGIIVTGTTERDSVRKLGGVEPWMFLIYLYSKWLPHMEPIMIPEQDIHSDTWLTQRRLETLTAMMPRNIVRIKRSGKVYRINFVTTKLDPVSATIDSDKWEEVN